MVLFYTDKIEGNKAYFTDDECRHIHQSLRKSTGDQLQFIDGRGSLYTAKIIDGSKRKVVVKILETKHVEPLKPYIHLAIAPTKNMDRIEWFLEKSIEIGIHEISLIQCKHSERKQCKMERLQRIMIAACKQSKKAYFPIINDIIPFDQWLQLQNNKEQQSFIACLTDQTKPLSQQYQKDSDVAICIGPEGGFRDVEIEGAIEYGFTAVHLGDQRLRTETAGIFALSTIQVLNAL